jgi:flagellar protein FliS
MLYDGALKFANQAIAAMEVKDYEKTNEFVFRVHDILREFQLTLNREHEICDSLEPLYEFMVSRLSEANVKKSIPMLEEVRDLIREFRDLWKDAMALAKITPGEHQGRVTAPSDV